MVNVLGDYQGWVLEPRFTARDFWRDGYRFGSLEKTLFAGGDQDVSAPGFLPDPPAVVRLEGFHGAVLMDTSLAEMIMLKAVEIAADSYFGPEGKR